jgi:hypothetical protein
VAEIIMSPSLGAVAPIYFLVNHSMSWRGCNWAEKLRLYHPVIATHSLLQRDDSGDLVISQTCDIHCSHEIKKVL